MTDDKQRDWSLLLKDGEEFDAPVSNGDSPCIRFKCVGTNVDVRTIGDNKRIAIYYRCITRAECESYAVGFLAGFREGTEFGRKQKGREIVNALKLES